MRRLAPRRYLLAGLLVTLPLWLLWLAASFLAGTLATASEPALRPLFRTAEARWGADLEWLRVPAGAALTLVAICLLGGAGLALARVGLRHRLARLAPRFPLLRAIYHGLRRLFRVLQAPPEQARQVVLIAAGEDGERLVGLLTQVLTDTVTGDEYAAVYVPTSPNPAAGHLHLVPVALVHRTDLRLQEALELVVSAGAAGPTHLGAARRAGAPD